MLHLLPEKIMVSMSREELLKAFDSCRQAAHFLIGFLLEYVEKQELGEVIHESCIQLQLWVNYLYDTICEDDQEKLKISTADQARTTLHEICSMKINDAEFCTTLLVLKQTFPLWGIPKEIL